MSLTGSWNIILSTPGGTQTAVLELIENNGGIAGVLRSDGKPRSLMNLVLQGIQLIWQTEMTTPFRLNFVFDVTFDGDKLTGTAKAKSVPIFNVTGTRVAKK